MEPNGVERRRHLRIQLRAYAYNQKAVVLKGGLSHSLNLVDISAGGVRISDAAGLADRFGVGDVLHVTFPGTSRLPQRMESIVRWIDAAQMGLQFQAELDLGLAEIQEIFR